MDASPETKHVDRWAAFLRQVALFQSLHEADLRSLAGDLRPCAFKKGETIFRQGDTDSSLYLIFKGQVRIFRLSPSGAETSINLLAAGGIIGEFAAIDGRPRSATAVALKPCVLLRMTGERLLWHMQALPALALGIARLLVDKLRWTSEYAEAIARYDAAGRLLHILLEYNAQFGQEIEKGKRYQLDLGLNQSDLASLVGARREWVNRILGSWHERRLIQYDRGLLTILDLPRVIAEHDSRLEANAQPAAPLASGEAAP